VIDGLDDTLVVEVHEIDLLVDHTGIKERELLGSSTYVVPGFVIEDTNT